MAQLLLRGCDHVLALGAIVCNSRHMFPRTGFWLGYLGYLLHFVGGSLGEDDWQPYEE